MSALKKGMVEMEKKHQEALASRDKELQSNIQAVKELKEEIAKLAQDRKATQPTKEDKS